ncbi:MAG: radical SAM protein [Desulfobacterales bacterium]|jgi:hypothetical protein
MRPQQPTIDVFHFVMIKPTHYDDDGYPIQWLRSAIPSNTLACLNGLAEDCQARRILGPSVEIRLHTYDETNRRIRPERIIRDINRQGGKGLIALVGVQTNQFPRAVDLARPFLHDRIPVCIGGFHVSGCVAMLAELPKHLKAAQRMGVSLFAGEAEDGRLDDLIKDAYRGTLRPLYNHMATMPDLMGRPAPILPSKHIRRTLGSLTSVDLGRGCPFNCSFCTIINVQGRKSRCRTPDDLERVVRSNLARGINRFFITDDNFARNRFWEGFFDRLIRLRESDGLDIKFTIQVDAQCHRVPGFIEKAARAGVARAFVGLESIRPENLKSADKSQNLIDEYRNMLQRWKSEGVITYAGYIVGFPNDTGASIRKDIDTIKRELPIDILQLNMLTPLPGSRDHLILRSQSVWMDPDLNAYDLDHRVTHHPVMSDREWEEAYDDAWNRFYTPEHMATVMRRAAAYGLSAGKIMFMMLWFSLSIRQEGVHPLEGGFIRLKFRKDRRPGLPVESPLAFYPKTVADILIKQVDAVRWLLRMNRIRKQIKGDPKRGTYMDRSMGTFVPDSPGKAPAPR